MARYILDTGVLIGYLRAAPYAKHVEAAYAPFKSPNLAAISVVTVGEIYSLSIQNAWGDKRRARLEELLREVPQVDIHNEEIIRSYAEIDTFSQGKHPSKSLGMTARNMGKNDVWIAATAAAIGATLLTTDHDFDHLDGVFMPVIFVDPHLTI